MSRTLVSNSEGMASRVFDYFGSIALIPRFFLQRCVQTKAETAKSTDPRMHSYSTRHVYAIARAITVLLAIGVLLVPVWLLLLIPMTHAQEATVLGVFVPLFCFIMSFITEARTLDIFVGSAACVYCAIPPNNANNPSYTAVLTSFIGNLSAGT